MMGITTYGVLNLCSRVGGSGRMEVLRVESDTDESAEKLMSDKILSACLIQS